MVELAALGHHRRPVLDDLIALQVQVDDMLAAHVAGDTVTQIYRVGGAAWLEGGSFMTSCMSCLGPGDLETRLVMFHLIFKLWLEYYRSRICSLTLSFVKWGYTQSSSQN